MNMSIYTDPGCYVCPHLTKHSAESRYCHGFGKKRPKGRRFLKKDPKYKAPGWCPRRISPAMVRVYKMTEAAKDIIDLADMLHRQYYPDTEPLTHLPRESQYALVAECRESITAGWFAQIADSDPAKAAEYISFRLDFGDVIQIDSGLSKHTFHYTASGWARVYWRDIQPEKT